MKRLILSFSLLDVNSLIILKREGFKSFYKHINGKFLTLLLFGIVVSFFSSSLIIGYYLENYYPYDKAGSYGIQARAASFVSHIEGSYTNVVGLPLTETVGMLRGIGFKNPKFLNRLKN